MSLFSVSHGPARLIDCDARWISAPNGQMVYDDWDDTLVPDVDYFCVGSEALTPWETMVLAIAGADYQIDPNLYLIQG